MPSLRDSGKLVGTFASLRETARQCHLSFPLSIREFIATPHCPFPRCNHLHFKVLANPTVPIETMLNRLREVCAATIRSAARIASPSLLLGEPVAS